MHPDLLRIFRSKNILVKINQNHRGKDVDNFLIELYFIVVIKNVTLVV